MNNLGEALKQALEKKQDFSSFIWKGEKFKDNNKKYIQNTERIDEMSFERLKECYEHCNKMLNNNNPNQLGRYNVIEEVKDQLNKCNVELFLRYCENTYLKREEIVPVPRFKMTLNIRSFIVNSEEEAEKEGVKLDWNNISITHLDSNLPPEFSDISIADALDGCTNDLGAFNKQHLTMTFITKMGLWITKSEENEFKGLSNQEKLKTIKERLYLPKELVLRFSEKGLSFHEMRAMLVLPKKQRYSDMTTEQLLTLRNKVLPRFLRVVDGHIFSWRRLQKQIEIVAKSKNWNLND